VTDTGLIALLPPERATSAGADGSGPIADLRGGGATSARVHPTLVGHGAIEATELADQALDDSKVDATFERSGTRTVGWRHVRVERPRMIQADNEPVDVFLPHQTWRGEVLSVGEDSFIARLEDLHGVIPDEEAEILLEEIVSDDRDLVREGAIFYWAVGYLEKVRGQRLRASLIRFRRLPRMTHQDWLQARNLAVTLGHVFGE
jgi:hypothetical protein